MERTEEDDGACDVDHDHIATEWRHPNQIDTCMQSSAALEKTEKIRKEERRAKKKRENKTRLCFLAPV